VAPRNTQTAAEEIGCHANTLLNYVHDELLVVPRTPSGRLCWFDYEIALARAIYEKNKPHRAAA
jgi:hypothetical protein